jgi:hypothetical protein
VCPETFQLFFLTSALMCAQKFSSFFHTSALMCTQKLSSFSQTACNPSHVTFGRRNFNIYDLPRHARMHVLYNIYFLIDYAADVDKGTCCSISVLLHFFGFVSRIAWLDN